MITRQRDNNYYDDGLKACACIWIFKSQCDDPNLGVENVLEIPYVPTQVVSTFLGIRRNSKELIKRVLSLEVNGIVLDGARFLSPVIGLEAFLIIQPMAYHRGENIAYINFI